MKRSTLNAIVDTIAFFPLIAAAITGIIIWLYLPRGTQLGALGTVPTHQTFFGVERIVWLDVHIYLGLVFTALVATHLILHWYYIKRLPQHVAIAKDKRDRSLKRFVALMLIGIGIVVAVIVAVYASNAAPASSSETPLSGSITATATSRTASAVPSQSATTSSSVPTSINGIPTSVNGLNYTYYHELNDRTTCRLCHTNL